MDLFLSSHTLSRGSLSRLSTPPFIMPHVHLCSIYIVPSILCVNSTKPEPRCCPNIEINKSAHARTCHTSFIFLRQSRGGGGGHQSRRREWRVEGVQEGASERRQDFEYAHRAGCVVRLLPLLRYVVALWCCVDPVLLDGRVFDRACTASY